LASHVIGLAAGIMCCWCSLDVLPTMKIIFEKHE